MPAKSPKNSPDWSFRLWGCRGSVSTGGKAKAFFGGLTTCFELDMPHGRILIDAGSGLAEMRGPGLTNKPTVMLISHLHWDHIVGLPHFDPLFNPNWNLDIRGVPREGHSVFDWVMEFNCPPVFPVHLGKTARASLSGVDLPPDGHDTIFDVDVAWREVAHPGGCSGFRMTVGGKTIVSITDVEVADDHADALGQFCDGADILILDAQYTDKEYERFKGFGHSSNTQVAQIARDLDVGQLLLTHHDPRHVDDAVREMIDEAKEIFPRTRGVRCGMVIRPDGDGIAFEHPED